MLSSRRHFKALQIRTLVISFFGPEVPFLVCITAIFGSLKPCFCSLARPNYNSIWVLLLRNLKLLEISKVVLPNRFSALLQLVSDKIILQFSLPLLFNATIASNI